MQAFRALVIGTLNIVAFLAFIAIIVAGVFTGMSQDTLVQLSAILPMEVQPWMGGILGGVVGYLTASVVLGILFILIDIQDGIRDLHRDLTRDQS